MTKPKSLQIFLAVCIGIAAWTQGTAALAGTPAPAQVAGQIAAKIDGKEWKNEKAEAIQTGKSMLNVASDSEQTEAISIIFTGKIAVGSYPLNHGVSASYTDASGTSYGSTDGTGTATITKYTPADGKTAGVVEGTFTGSFAADAAKKLTFSDGTFSMPVNNL